VTNGSFNAITGGGAVIAGNGTGTVSISGTAAQINAALSGANYVNTQDYNGTANLTVSTSDGIAPAVVNTVPVTVSAVVDITNDTVSTNEDTPISFNAITGSNGATADTFENPARAVTAVTNGAHGTVSFLADGTLTYTPASNYNGPDSFTYTVTSGGVTETATVTVNIAAVNDAPINTVPAAQITPEDSPLVFSAGNGNAITVTDPDGAGVSLTTTITVTNGSFNAITGGGAVIAGNGTGTVTISGTAAQINADLSGANYVNTQDYNGTANITVSTSDGIAPAVVNTVPVTVSAVVDITNDTVSTNEDTPISFNAITGTNGATADTF
jgi:VCBS repeat-containing protein